MVPSPMVSSGTALNTHGIDTNSARFKAAWAKCRRSVDLGRSYFYRPTADKHAGSRGP
jgi:hypothetical protein